VAKDWKRNLRVVWVAELLAIMGFSSTAPIYAYFIQYLGVEQQSVARWSGIVIGISSISMGLLGPIWGALGDRHGRKVMVMRAMFGGAVIIGLQGFSQNVWQFAALRLIQGALTGTVTAATAMVASNTPRERLGETLGQLQLAIFLGNALGPTTGGLVADTLGYRATFWLTAIYLLTAGSLILFLVHEHFTPTAEALQGSLWRRMYQDIGMIFTSSLLGLVLWLRFALRVSLNVTAPTMPLIVQSLMPDSTLLGSASGLLTTVSGISSALAAPVVGRWADRGNGRALLFGSALLEAAALIVQAVAPVYWLLVVAQFLLGFGVGGALAVISAYIGRMAPEGRIGTAFGLDAMAVSIAGAIGPSVGGWLSDTVSRRSPLWVGGIAMLVAGLTVLRLPNPKDRRRQVSDPKDRERAT
jgi:MFS transporter, DHA1 family, multidrug resistance protein